MLIQAQYSFGMQLMHMQFLVSFAMQLTTSAGNQQLIDFVGQIKSSHLDRCREIVLVYAEPLPIANKLIRTRAKMVPFYTTDGYWDPGFLGASCGVIFTSLTSELIIRSTLFSNKAHLLYVIDTGRKSPQDIVLAEDFIEKQHTKCTLNSVFILFDASSSQGYYLDPFTNATKTIVNSSRSIHSKLGAINDLHGYELFFAFVPSETDRPVVHTIINSLADERNGTIQQLVGLAPEFVLNITLSHQWRFTLVTFGPQEYATCFFVPPAGFVPIGYILVEPFDTVIWIGILLTGSVVVVLMKLFGHSSLLESAIMLLQSVFTSPNRISRTFFERRILTACMVGCLVLVSSYQSLVYSLITNPARYPELDTEQLINRSCDIYMLNDLGGMDTFRSSFVDDALFHPGISCICSTCRLEDAMRAKSTLMNLYRVSRHRTHAFPMLIIFFGTHYPPLNELVQLYVSGFFESGLTGKLVQDMQAKKNGAHSSVGHEQRVSSQQLRVSDLQIVWIVLEIGLACGGCCFLGELVWTGGRKLVSKWHMRSGKRK